MECPYCKNTMEKGFLPAERTASFWIPDTSNPYIMVYHKPKNGIQLTKFPVISIQQAESYYCRQCEVVLTPVNKDLNKPKPII